jgi:23S rRNA-/tRNA-specific pseudouridylate synthase
MSLPVKLSSPATREFWEIPVRYEDEHLLALDKPAGLALTAVPLSPERPALVPLLHAAIAAGKPWAAERHLDFLLPAHRLDPEISGVLLFARSKAVLTALTDQFGSGTTGRTFVALVYGTPRAAEFEVDAKLSPHPEIPEQSRLDLKQGKKSQTRFRVLETFAGLALVQCEPLTDRPQQIRLHLRQAGLRVVGDLLHGGGPLYLSRFKRDYRLKPGREERPMISTPALHAEALHLPHPVTGVMVSITAPWPKDLIVAVKYLRQYAV